MLGLVFTEFIEMVEDRFSPALAEAVIEDAAPAHGGAYTAVGYYGHDEMVALVSALSRRTGLAVPDLVQAFGHHLAQRFVAGHAAMFTRHSDLFSLAAAIDSEIHVEVRKLYDKATLPRFSVLSRDDRRMALLYESPRGMEHLALGLLEGVAEHYGERCRIAMAPWAQGERRGVLFELERSGG